MVPYHAAAYYPKSDRPPQLSFHHHQKSILLATIQRNPFLLPLTTRAFTASLMRFPAYNGMVVTFFPPLSSTP